MNAEWQGLPAARTVTESIALAITISNRMVRVPQTTHRTDAVRSRLAAIEADRKLDEFLDGE